MSKEIQAFENKTEQVNTTSTERVYRVYKRIAPDGRVYIGCTTNTLEERAGHNGCNYRKHTRLMEAIRKYGWDSFRTELLLETTDIHEASKAESDFIAQYEATNPEKGFNFSGGGYITDPTYIDRITEINRTHNADPEIRKKIQESCMAVWDDEAKRAEHGKMIKEKLSDESMRQKISENTVKGIKATGEAGVERRAQIAHDKWNNPEMRQKINEARNAAMHTTEYHDMMSTINKEVQNRPEQKELRSKHFKGLVFIHNDETSKRVTLEEGEQLVATGKWVWGRRHTGPRSNTTSFQNKAWVTNGTENLHVDKDEIDAYLAKGYRRGLTQLRKKESQPASTETLTQDGTHKKRMRRIGF